jgi:hypothetical protein
MASQSWTERTKFERQVRGNSALLGVLLEHEPRRWFWSMLKPSLKALKIRFDASAVYFRQLQSTELELD